VAGPLSAHAQALCYRSAMELERRLADRRTLVITHAEPDDPAAIVAYVERACGESDFLTFGPGEFGISVEDETRFIAALDGGRFDFMLKGVVDGEIVSACMIMRPKRPRVRHIGDFGISVARSCWGLGVGRHMCLAVLDVARRVGVTKVNLQVRDDNARAMRLYESVGFRREGVTERALRIGDRYFANVMMGIALD
jgi:RimJ/RimL family protein N-acetyltransferase